MDTKDLLLPLSFRDTYMYVLSEKRYTENAFKKIKKENYLINLIGKYAFLLGVCWEVFR